MALSNSQAVLLLTSIIMAPVLLVGAARALNLAGLLPRNAFPGVKTQWQQPSDLFSILLLVGGDIIQRAIAQLSSPYYITPVAFSFGWVSYAVSAITSAIGDGKLMPETDCPSLLINTKSGYSRNNSSWVLGRILRDWDEECLTDKKTGEDYALVVTLCKQISPKGGKVRPAIDMVWLFGVLTIVAQICVAIIPGVKDGAWTVLVITAGGTLVCLGQSCLPQWSAEKFKCRRVADGKRQVVALTRGNGHNHVLVITSEADGLNLEDLAVGRVNKHKTTLPFTFLLSVLWFIVLLTAIAVQENTWYLLLVGSMGMVQNIFAAGYKRDPSAFGIYLETYATVKPLSSDPSANKVFPVLQAAETKQPGLGLALLPIFFPGELFPAEQTWKDNAVLEFKGKGKGTKVEKVAVKADVEPKSGG